ncbi:MAG: sulfatase [Verrucomicrobia bacterium]|nr:sulfatase [Verrucomicrobiota bacterium]
MKTRLLSLALAIAALALASPRLAAASRPNLVVILIDDLGWLDLSCQGSDYYRTPHIDRLAAEGIRFTHGYAACAVCSPSRAALMTGRHPARLGITDWMRMSFQKESPADPALPAGYERETYNVASAPGEALLTPRNPRFMPHSEITIAELLGPAGYRCGYLGKWHLGDAEWSPETQGFHSNIGGCDLGQPPSYFDPYANNTWAKNGIPTLPARRKGEYLTDRLGDEAVKFIESNRERPFFLYLAHYAVHAPIEARPDIEAGYAGRRGKTQSNAAYAAMVQSVDEATGRLVETLDRLGLSERTVIVFTSDNGGEAHYTNNAPLRAGKSYAYEGGIRVPWIVRWPGVIRAASISAQPISSIDLLPTLAELAGVALPKDRPIDGVSLAAHLKSSGKRPLAPRPLYWHFPHYRAGGPAPYSIVRSGDWKLIKNWEGPKFELFNLKEDEGEQHDRAGDSGQKVKKLDALLSAHLKTVGAKLPRKAGNEPQ